MIVERDDHDSLDEPHVGEDMGRDDDHRTEPSLSLNADDIGDEPPSVHRRHADAETDEPHASERFSALDGDDDRDPAPPLQDDDEDERPHAHGKRERSEPALRDRALLDLTDDPLQLAWQSPSRAGDAACSGCCWC